MENDNQQFTIATDFRGIDVWLRSGERHRVSRDQLEDKLFRDQASGDLRSGEWLLGLLLNFDGENLRQYVLEGAVREALKTGECRGKPDLAVENDAETFSFKLGETFVPFDKAEFDLELTVRPKPGD